MFEEIIKTLTGRLSMVGVDNNIIFESRVAVGHFCQLIIRASLMVEINILCGS